MSFRPRLGWVFMVLMALMLVLSACERPFASDTASPDISQVTSNEGATPAEGEAAPAEGEGEAAEGEAAPTEGEAAPAEGEAAPVEGEAPAAPAEGEAAPEGYPAAEESPRPEGETAPAEGEGAGEAAAPAPTENEGEGEAAVPAPVEGEGEAAAPAPAPVENEAAAPAPATPSTTTNADGDLIHTVQAGETLYRIGLMYNVSWLVLADYNELRNANSIMVGDQLLIPTAEMSADPAPTPTPVPTDEITYTVQAGDTLFKIGQQYNVDWRQIAEANGIINPNRILVGTTLKIPTSSPGPSPEFTHEVEQGETVFEISLQYGVTWSAIAEANGLEAPYVIFPGDVLTIPSN